MQNNKIINKFKTYLVYMPDKTKIFLFAFWVWTWILFKLTLVANYVLGAIIKHLPQYLMPGIKTKIPVTIIKAVDCNGTEVTDKLQMFMNFKWDKTMFDKHGGVDLDIFFKYIGSSVVWIAYILDYDINTPTCMHFMTLLDNTDTPLDDFKKYIKIVVIDAGKKIMHKLNTNTTTIETEDISFGEVNFYET